MADFSVTNGPLNLTSPPCAAATRTMSNWTHEMDLTIDETWFRVNFLTSERCELFTPGTA